METPCSQSNAYNAYWDNETYTPNQSVLTASLLPAFLTYSVGGGIACVCNIICLLVFITKKDLREKNLFFAVLAFGNLLNNLFCLIAGILRRRMIYANQFLQIHSIFRCLQQPGPHLQILGGQLPALVLLAIALQRLFAVYKPISYKVYFTMRKRVAAVLGCFLAVFISHLVGVLSSYLSRDICVISFCSPTAAFGYAYGNFHTIIIIILPFVALIVNVAAYFVAKRLGDQGNMKKEIRMILVAAAITFLDLVLIAFPNILLFCTGNSLITMNQATLAYMYVLFCCNSAIDLFIYICLKRDFRHHLLISMSFGALKPYLKENQGIRGVRPMKVGDTSTSRQQLQNGRQTVTLTRTA